MAGNHNSGGKRIGAGRKRKPIAEKLLEGERGHRNTTVMQFETLPNSDETAMPASNKMLAQQQMDGSFLQATELYNATYKWLEERGCATLVAPQLLDRYAMAMARWIHCEEIISSMGYLAKHPTTGNPIQSPYVAMSQSYMSQANRLWTEIFSIVRENSLSDCSAGTPQEDVMEQLLQKKK